MNDNWIVAFDRNTRGRTSRYGRFPSPAIAVSGMGAFISALPLPVSVTCKRTSGSTLPDSVSAASAMLAATARFFSVITAVPIAALAGTGAAWASAAKITVAIWPPLEVACATASVPSAAACEASSR